MEDDHSKSTIRIKEGIDLEEFIKDWLEQHYTKDMSGKDIIVGLMDALLLTSKLNDTAYPNLREKILKAVAET